MSESEINSSAIYPFALVVKVQAIRICALHATQNKKIIK